jgi:hypothetical protein
MIVQYALADALVSVRLSIRICQPHATNFPLALTHPQLSTAPQWPQQGSAR